MEGVGTVITQRRYTWTRPHWLSWFKGILFGVGLALAIVGLTGHLS